MAAARRALNEPSWRDITATDRGKLIFRPGDLIEAHAQTIGETETTDSGNYFQPTLVECPHTDIETLKVEMFGPVMSIVPFDTEEEAIAMANDGSYGLGPGQFTQNLARAHRVSRRLIPRSSDKDS